MSQSGLNRAIKSGQPYCFHCTRATLMSMQKGSSFCMQEPKVITIDDVIYSNVMHSNKGNPLFVREGKGRHTAGRGRQ